MTATDEIKYSNTEMNLYFSEWQTACDFIINLQCNETLFYLLLMHILSLLYCQTLLHIGILLLCKFWTIYVHSVVN